MSKPTHVKPNFYTYCFLELKEIAKEFGYNLVIHGSMNRDLDLIAIPWVDDPEDEFDLINAISLHLTGYRTTPEYKEHFYDYKELPGGRHCYVINMNRGGYARNVDGKIIEPLLYKEDPQWYLDISVTKH